MQFPVSRRRSGKVASATLAAAIVVSAVLGSGFSPARAAGPPSPPAADAPDLAAAKTPNPFAGHFPDVVLRTHEGNNVRFYEDLLKDKIVLINFMYATCEER